MTWKLLQRDSQALYLGIWSLLKKIPVFEIYSDPIHPILPFCNGLMIFKIFLISFFVAISTIKGGGLGQPKSVLGVIIWSFMDSAVAPSKKSLSVSISREIRKRTLSKPPQEITPPKQTSHQEEKKQQLYRGRRNTPQKIPKTPQSFISVITIFFRFSCWPQIRTFYVGGIQWVKLLNSTLEPAPWRFFNGCLGVCMAWPCDALYQNLLWKNQNRNHKIIKMILNSF